MSLEHLATVNAFILNGEIDAAEKLLKTIKPATTAEKRTYYHQQALLFYNRNKVSEARQLLENAITKYGDNVNLTRDLAVCFYRLQDMVNFRQLIERLEKDVISHEAILSQRSLFECDLMLGKFLEEDARLAPALIFYERALQRATTTAQRIRVLIQKTRWHALYEGCDQLSSYYRELISVPADTYNNDFQVELQHSLMLVEMRLIGSDHAWQRIERLLPTLSDFDQRLMIFDFVEGCYSQDLNIPPLVLEIINGFKDLDAYEHYLKKLLEKSLTSEEKIHQLTQLAPKLSWSSYLRLLCLTANLETSSSAKQELHRKIQLIVKSLDPRTQNLWNHRLKQSLQTPETKIEISSRDRSIKVQGRVIDLSKKKIGMQMLETLYAKPSLTVDDMIAQLWQTSFSPEHYHRLRMSAHRLNTLIYEASGVGKVIEVDSQNVRLRAEIKLRSMDMGESWLV